MFSLCHQAAWWHRSVSRGHVTFLSSCLAGTLVAFGRQAAWRLGVIGMLSWLLALCKQYLFRSGLGGLVRPDPVAWRRPGLHRSRTTHQDKMCRSSQDTSFLRFSVMTHMSRHIVVAPILLAPLLTDTRRSTVGPGTREDIACVVGGVRRTSALRNIGGAVRCVDLPHGALRPLRHGCTCRRRRRSTSCGALQVTTTRETSCSRVLSSPSMSNLEHWFRIHRRPGPRGETGAGRDELLWRLEGEDAAVLNCGVLMRIEPTGHLDVDYIRWLKDWLESFAGNMLTMFVKSTRRRGVLRNELRRLRSCTCCQHRCGGHHGTNKCFSHLCLLCR